jgi:hypothetical protein
VRKLYGGDHIESSLARKDKNRLKVAESDKPTVTTIITTVKSFTVQASGTNVIKHFTAVSYASS